MARRRLKRNVSNEVRVEKLIEALESSSPGPLAKALDDHDWRDIRRLPHGPAREEKFGELRVALEPLLIRVAPPDRRKKTEEKVARGRAGRDPGVSAAREAAAQRKTRKEAEASGHRTRPRGSRRGMGAGSQIAEFTENVIIGRGYRGYSFEVEEIAPDKWDATVIYEPIISISGGPTVKGTEFPVTKDPDLLISKVKERIDETLTWYAKKGIEPKRTSRRKATPRRKVGRTTSRRGERIEAEQDEIEAEARAETAAAAEQFSRSYVQFGYDPDASKAENVRNMEAKVSALRDEIRVTRDLGARRDLSELVDTIVSMVKRLKSGKSAFATTRGRRNPGIKKPRPSSLPFKTKKNPRGFFSRDDPAMDAGRKWEKEYEKQVRKWMRSIDRKNPDFVAMMDAYDAIELSRANYFLADDETKSMEMGSQKRELQGQIIELLETGGKEVLSRAQKEVGKRAEATRSPARSSATENPTAKRHGKTGRDYLKKADAYWERYYEKGKSKDLIDAYKYLTLAHEELKYAGDKEKLKEAKAGLNAATAELKLGLE